MNSDSISHIEHRQTCRFDYFKGGKFGSLRNLKMIAFKSATNLYISRYVLVKTHNEID